MIYHLVIGYRKKIRFTFLCIYFIPVTPHFFKCSLHYIPCIFLMTKILKDEAVHIICILRHTVVVFFFSHKQPENSDKNSSNPLFYSNTSHLPECYGLRNYFGHISMRRG